LDPLQTETWYKIPAKLIYKHNSGRIILQKFGGYFSALKTIFPDVRLSSTTLQCMFY
jgi:hypothetical protein